MICGIAFFLFDWGLGWEDGSVGVAYFGFLAEAEPGVSHELALAVGEGVLGVDGGSHARREG